MRRELLLGRLGYSVPKSSPSLYICALRFWAFFPKVIPILIFFSPKQEKTKRLNHLLILVFLEEALKIDTKLIRGRTMVSKFSNCYVTSGFRWIKLKNSVGEGH